MSIKNILVHVDASPRSAATVKAAASVARRFQAKLTGFFVVPDIAVAAAVPGGAAMSSQIVDEMQKDAEKQAADAEKIFRDNAGTLAASDGWMRADAMGIGSRAAAAKVTHYADLIVAGHPSAEDRNENSGAGVVQLQDLVLDSGRPLLLVPENGNVEVPGRNIMVAWSESREATRAVFDALPFFETADRITVATATTKPDEEPAPGEAIARVLKDHGFTVSTGTVALKDGQSTSAALIDHAKEIGADLVVAGAYSHSRLREGLFGGVTKSLLEAAPLPVLMSH